MGDEIHKNKQRPNIFKIGIKSVSAEDQVVPKKQKFDRGFLGCV